MMRYCLILIGILFSVSVVAAEETASGKKKPKPLSVEAEVGMIVTSGNTESTSFAGKLDISQDLKSWKNNYILSGFYKEDEVVIEDTGPDVTETQTTADKIFASVQSDYKLDSEHKGLFVYGSYEDDKFSGFDYQATIAFGYSNRLFETDKSWFDYNIGPGMAIARTLEATDDVGNIIPSEKTETVAVRLSGSYVYKFTDHAKFTQKVSSDVSGDSEKNTKVKSETGLTATINGSMALKLSYTINHNTRPPFDKEKTDMISAVTLVFTY